ncbi:ribosome maturation factor RimP, partial [Desulfovibrio sp. OttesenSCG-928-G11]|nr:ribosome maturation factor RimP [Desulfovibrio sp. OttesenSCG-928-G11]
MAQHRLLEQLKSLAGPLAQSLGLSLWGIEILSGPRMVLRVYLDKAQAAAPDKGRAAAPDKGQAAAPAPDDPFGEPFLAAQGVGVDDCASFSRLFGL